MPYSYSLGDERIKQFMEIEYFEKLKTDGPERFELVILKGFLR